MCKFNHPNVLTLKGVCLDGGPAPYIIMPFMANGSLLAYLHKSRDSLVIINRDKDDKVSYNYVQYGMYLLILVLFSMGVL